MVGQPLQARGSSDRSQSTNFQKSIIAKFEALTSDSLCDMIVMSTDQPTLLLSSLQPIVNVVPHPSKRAIGLSESCVLIGR